MGADQDNWTPAETRLNVLVTTQARPTGGPGHNNVNVRSSLCALSLPFGAATDVILYLYILQTANPVIVVVKSGALTVEINALFSYILYEPTVIQGDVVGVTHVNSTIPDPITK